MSFDTDLYGRAIRFASVLPEDESWFDQPGADDYGICETPDPDFPFSDTPHMTLPGAVAQGFAA